MKVYLAIATTTIFWASAFVGIRAGLESYSPGSLALLRYLVASICMLFLYLRVHHKHKPTLKEFIQLFILGVIGFGIYNITLNYGELTVPAGIASFIVSLIPVGIAVLALIFLREKMTLFAWIGLVISVIGIIIIAIGESEDTHFDFGVIFCIIAALTGAIYSAFQKPLLKKFNPIEINSIAIWSGTLVMMFYFPQMLHQIPHATFKATFAAVYMGIFPAAVAYVTWSYVLSHMPASQACRFLYLLPIVTIFMGWSFLGEIPASVSMIGGFIALAGAIVAAKK